jgi:hypothetical protein
MIRFTIFAACVLGSLSAALGQTNSSVPQSATTSGPAPVRTWHRQYFHREPDLRSVAGWSYWFRLGHSPEQVLAAMLSTDEYYRRAGSTPEGLVQAMFDDGAPGELVGDARQAWLRRARGTDRGALAASFVQAHPEALQAHGEVARSVLAARQRSVTSQAVGAQPRAQRREANAATNRRSTALRS